ncbi:hypothetical protein AB1Y20_017252 [Prymnesium parvum]|uniref:Cyclic nucleotide-binding domain-containing protein n=1 Tax=Prymnesium parvum TaxID=97485 RepID=A0AB34JMP7_PRYPA
MSESVTEVDAGLVPLLSRVAEVLLAELSLPRAFVHASALLGLSGTLSTNILVLRSLSVLSSASALLFNIWNRLRSPIIWNLTFMTTNLAQIARLLLRDQQQLTISTDEQALFELAFARYGVRIKEFLELLKEAGAEWVDYEEGAFIVRRGDEMPCLWYLVEGEVEALHSGEDTHVTIKPGKGGWLGELWDPNEPPDYWQQPHHWKTGFRAMVPSRVVSFDRKRLHDFIARSPHMRDAAEAAEIADLWGKLRSSFSQSTRNVYKAMLQMAMADGDLEPAEREALDKFVARNPLDLGGAQQHINPSAQPQATS